MSNKKPVFLSKEESIKLVAEDLTPLKEFSTNLVNLVDNLRASAVADASIATVEKAGVILRDLAECKERIVRIRKTMECRCRSRLRELSKKSSY
jgi:hypothetical protein